MPTRHLLAEAANPETPPDLLGDLARIGPRAICQAIAANPNTPPGTLADLCVYCGREVAENPALPLLLLENPAWLKERTLSELRGLLKGPRPPKAVFTEIRGRLGTGEPIPPPRAHPAGSPRLLYSEALRHPCCPVRLLEEAARVNPWIGDPAHLREDIFRHSVARNPSTPPSVLSWLSGDPYAAARVAVAWNPNTPRHTLDALRLSTSKLARRAVIARALRDAETERRAP